jgi:hypothetical protein
MARRRRSYRRYYARPRRRSSSGLSTRGLMGGLYKPKGIIAGALIGAGTALVASKLIGQQIPYQGPIAGFVTGGLPGAAAAYALQMFTGGNGGGIAYY